MMFWRTWRLFAKKERPRGGIIGGFEFILFFFLMACYIGYTNLSGIRQHDAFTFADTWDFLLIGSPGLYGLRVARFIAEARKYRLPQTLEWLVFIVPLAVFFTCAVGSSHFVQSYAAARGYQFCGPRSDHASIYVFVRPPERCPVIPQGQYWKR